MYGAQGWTPPQVAHLPVILGADRKKLGKRHGDTALRDYWRQGFLPEALLNFFALMAWHPEEDREVYSVEELIGKFRLEDVGQASPIFDTAKLTWLNGVYVRDLLARDPDRVVEMCLDPLAGAGLIEGAVTPEFRAYVAQVVAILGERVKVGHDILTYGDFFFTRDVRFDPEAVHRYLTNPQLAGTLSLLRDRVAGADSFDAGKAETLVRALAEELGIHTREIIHPTRVALTGKTVGPGLFDLMALLGQERVVTRLDRAIEMVRDAPAVSDDVVCVTVFAELQSAFIEDAFRLIATSKLPGVAALPIFSIVTDATTD
jgi:glutamyl-tRNA synthetase